MFEGCDFIFQVKIVQRLGIIQRQKDTNKILWNFGSETEIFIIHATLFKKCPKILFEKCKIYNLKLKTYKAFNKTISK